LRVLQAVEDEQGDLVRTEVLDELFGDPPSISQFEDHNSHESRLDLVELGFSCPIGECVELDLVAEWGREEIEIEQVLKEVPVRLFDDTVDQFGGEGTLAADLSSDVRLTLSGGHHQRPTETSEPGVFFTFDDERTSHASLECRWNASSTTTFSGHARKELRDSEPFGSEGDLDRYGLSMAGHPCERLWLDTSVTYQSYDLTSETIFLSFDPVLGILAVPGIASFDSRQYTLAGAARYEASESFLPRAGFTVTSSSGDSEFDYLTIRTALPYVLESGLEVGLEAALYGFDGDDLLEDSDYDAFVLELYVRKSFGGWVPGS
jgi:hypothetical protein